MVFLHNNFCYPSYWKFAVDLNLASWVSTLYCGNDHRIAREASTLESRLTQSKFIVGFPRIRSRRVTDFRIKRHLSVTMFTTEDLYAPFQCRGRASGYRSNAVQMPLLPEYCRQCAVTHTDILPITCCHRMPYCWHIYTLTVYYSTVAIVPTWCNRAVRMLLPR